MHQATAANLVHALDAHIFNTIIHPLEVSKMTFTSNKSRHCQATIIELELQELNTEYYAGNIDRATYNKERAELTNEIDAL